jgi:AAA15 family ATPase/GTPase
VWGINKYLGEEKMYKTIQIEGIRGIKKLLLEDFQQFNLFVGKNECGKTTVLESLFLITGPTNPGLPLKINNFRENTSSMLKSVDLMIFNLPA